MQSETGVQALRADIRTPPQKLSSNCNINYGICPYTSHTLLSFYFEYQVTKIEEIFEWQPVNRFPSKEAEIINEIYLNGTPLEKESRQRFRGRSSTRFFTSLLS